MFCRGISSFVYVFLIVAISCDYSESDSSAGSDPEVTVYRFKTNHPWEIFRDDHASGRAENLEDLIMAHDHERESLLPKTNHNFKNLIGETPYYETSDKDYCKENNGNCSQKCETVGFQRVCSCREGYTLTSTTECSEISECGIVLSGTSGQFTVEKNSCEWTIKAPDNHIIEIKLRISKEDYYEEDWFGDQVLTPPNGNAYAEIHDGNLPGARVIQQIDEDMEETVLRSSGQSLLIKSHHGWENQGYTLHVSYVTGPQYLQISDHRTVGELLISDSSLPDGDVCLSLTYSIHSIQRHIVSSVILWQEKDADSEIIFLPKFSFERHDKKWTRHIYLIPFQQGGYRLKFRFYGEDRSVYNLGRCLNLEYHAIGGKKYVDPATVCRNGGIWDETSQSCTCLQGFVGNYCEEGCGPNRYGQNCSSFCSDVSSACEGMLFCTKELCTCAPGIKGSSCRSSCQPGHYGASCLQQCGECKDQKPCDQYTGICYSGCADGFYPPFCQQTYKVLAQPPDIVAVTFNSLKLRIPFQNVTGGGEPTLYEVQYKEEEEIPWSKLSPRIISNETEFEVMGLLPGKVYETRVILIDKDGGSYQKDIPINKTRTKCVDAHQADYNFTVIDVGESSLTLEWSYEHDKSSLLCEIVDFELTITSRDGPYKFPIAGKQGRKTLSYMMPDTSYGLQLVGKTVTGKETPPVEIAVHTQPSAPERVRAVQVVPLVSGRQLNISWQPSWDARGGSQQYKVTYQCIELLACKYANCDTSFGDIKVSTTSAVLQHLQPNALYQIEVATVSDDGLVSEGYVVKAVTAQAAPHVAPGPAENAVLAVTNTSALISWEPPEDCSTLNGYIYGYSYALVENDTEEIIQQGTVPENILRVNFSGLTPSHCYNAHITVVASGGDSISNLLVIPFCTSSTAPDRVQSLSVYKRGRRMVGLRWSPPINTYGDIAYFTITYSTEGSNYTTRLYTEPKYCGAWVDLYCYTVSGLSPGKKYHFEVRTGNTESSIEGDPAAVEAITSEGASSPPENLSVVNATENSLLVEWGMPNNVNGQLRSFIIIVERIDTQLNSGECCDDIPLQDYRVTSEEPFYQYEVTGLSAASTYSVTVSAKTVTLGEESRVIGHTYPPKPSLPPNALMIVKTEGSSSETDDVTLQIRPAGRINGVNRTYILLCLTNDSSKQQSHGDNHFTTLLQSKFAENYYIISEYTQEELENQAVVTISLKDQVHISRDIKPQKYALVLVQEYLGNQSLDIYDINVSEDTGV